ncbi:MAG: hypothetical protein KBS60_00070, partial [Phascolarctobacterium sp.]|nr:hypothetical protein [Candidatus Phascolarctobacterium caballi]
MEKNLFISKKVLAALTLGSIVYAPQVFADSTFTVNGQSFAYRTGDTDAQKAEQLYNGYLARMNHSGNGSTTAVINDDLSDLHLEYIDFPYTYNWDGPLSLYAAHYSSEGYEGQDWDEHNNSTSGNVLNVTVNSGGKIGQLVGAFNSEDGAVNNNQVTISGNGEVIHSNNNDFGYSAAAGHSENGVANNNTLTINGCSFHSDVFAGAGRNVEGNKVIINAGNFEDRIVGAYTDGNATNNMVKIIGGVFKITENGETPEGLNDIIGADEAEGTSATSTFTQNGVEINGGTFTVTPSVDHDGRLTNMRIMGAYANKGTLSGNYVKITGGEFTTDGDNTLAIYGAKSETGNVTNNRVEIGITENFNIKGAVIGGFSMGGSNVSNNSVTIESAGTIVEKIYDDFDWAVAGGLSLSDFAATVSNNSVTVNNMTIEHGKINAAIAMTKRDFDDVLTADDIAFLNNYPGIIAENNTVIIKGVNGSKVYGVEFDKGTARNNKILIETGNFSEARIRGVDGAELGGTVENNIVEIQNGTFNRPRIQGVNAGLESIGNPDMTVNASMNNNKVIVKGGIFDINNPHTHHDDFDNETIEYSRIVGVEYTSGKIYNGTVPTDENMVYKGTVTISKNSVDITGGTFKFGNPTGYGYQDTDQSVVEIAGAIGTYGKISENSVSITGATFIPDDGAELKHCAVNIYGAKSEEGTVTGNKVEIKNVTIPASIYGGYSDGTVNVNDNLVTLNNVTINGTKHGELFGGRGYGTVSHNKVNLVNVTIERGDICGGYSGDDIIDNNLNNLEVLN